MQVVQNKLKRVNKMKPPKLNKTNYYQDKYFWSASFVKAMMKCPACAISERKGKYTQPTTTALMVGAFVDAYFDGKKQFERFVSEHSEIYNKRTGELKADYVQALAMIQRASSDSVFMLYCTGQKQKIMTGTIGDIPFKCKMDFYKKGRFICDLKTVKDFSPVYLPEQGKVSFADAYNWPLQMAIYQELVYQNTGDRLPCYLACITKQDPPDISIVEIPQNIMDAEIEVLMSKIPYFDAMLSGIVDVERCECCRYCRETKQIQGPIKLDEMRGF